VKSESVVSPRFSRRSDFAKELYDRSKVILQEHADDKGLGYVLKILCVFTLALGSYGLIFLIQDPVMRIGLALFSGVAHTLIGFHLFHDAHHASLSEKAWVNRAMAFLSCSLLGVSGRLWQFKHNYLHHQFTNIHQIDDDLETREALRLSPFQETLSKYRLQHLYAPFMYAMTSIEWVFIRDFKVYFSGRLNQFQKIPKFTLDQHLEFWITKIIYFALYVVLPLSLLGVKTFVIGAICFHWAHSLAMAAIFQLAHVMPEGQQTSADSGREMDVDHATHQMLTTVNFGINNAFLNWFSGGLNFQIEHHLFPRVQHRFYPKLAPMVKELARKHNIPYYEYPSYSSALKAHFKELRSLGYEGRSMALEEQNNIS
jgi:linoleoyl-CoA desaturase